MNEHLPSGIVFSDEEHVVYQTDENVKAIEVKYYWSQIQLRITLNSIHQQLYKDTPSESTSIHIVGVGCTALTTKR